MTRLPDFLARDSLPPKVMQLVGLGGLVVLGVFWGFTGRIEPTLLATTGGLVGIGHYAGAVKSLTSRDESSDTLPPGPAHSGERTGDARP
jgi:hypothetical protein